MTDTANIAANAANAPNTALPSSASLPNVPNAPSMPSAANVPNVPSVPTAPSMPSAANVPGAPSMPSAPNVPSAPSMPNVPGASNVPNPAAGATPATGSDASAAPGTPAAAATSTAPGAPAADATNANTDGAKPDAAATPGDDKPQGTDAAGQQDGGAPATVDIDITALQANGDGLSGLKTTFLIDDDVLFTGVTGDDGKLCTVQAPPGAFMRILVERWDGTQKEIHSRQVPWTDAQLTLVSPSFIKEVTTEAHDGAPGSIEDSVPHYAAGDYGALKDASEVHAAQPATPASQGAAPASQPAAPAAQTATPAAKPAAPASAPAAKPAAAAQPAAGAAAKKSTAPVSTTAPDTTKAAAKQEQAKTGRDKAGKPAATFTEKVSDWWGSWHMPTLHLWGAPGGGAPISAGAKGGADKKADKKADQGKAAQSGAAASTAANTSAKAAPVPAPASTGQAIKPGSEVQHRQDMVKQLDDLIAFCDVNVTRKYKKGSTTEILKDLATGHPGFTDKDETTSLGFCYKYVKTALVYRNIIKGAPDGECASEAGPKLVALGFTDVTDQLPDHRWAAAGDVIVYAWSQQTWEERKAKKKAANLPNYGHIEIRSVETYYSDYTPERDRSYTNNFKDKPKKDSNGKVLKDDKGKDIRELYMEYVNIRIYRKVYDIMPTLRIKAFLKVLTDFECTHIPEADRYKRLCYALPGSQSMTFSSFATHPFQGTGVDNHKTAAGAYQIQLRSWEEWVQHGVFDGVKDKFSPAIQDRIAVFLMERRKALQHVRKGDLDKAVELLRPEWTSLPGAAENAKRKDAASLTMSNLKALFGQYLDAEMKAHGL